MPFSRRLGGEIPAVEIRRQHGGPLARRQLADDHAEDQHRGEKDAGPGELPHALRHVGHIVPVVAVVIGIVAVDQPALLEVDDAPGVVTRPRRDLAMQHVDLE
jgi:hypothetical protein